MYLWNANFMKCLCTEQYNHAELYKYTHYALHMVRKIRFGKVRMFEGP